MSGLICFLTESLHIEGIFRDPTSEEIAAFERFFSKLRMTRQAVCELQEVFAPGKPLRASPGMNVRVGNYTAPLGGPGIEPALMRICMRANNFTSVPWRTHLAFERLHPFMDGNGRTGRALWAWHMRSRMADPFTLSFLHRWYYQTLECARP